MPRFVDKRLLPIAFLALLLLGGAIGMELYRSQAGPPSERSPSILTRLWNPSPTNRPLSAPTVSSPLASSLPEGSRETVSGEDLLGFLMSKRDSPAARAFAEVFMRQPELARAWEKFAGDKDAREFVHAVRRSDAFRGLLAVFTQREEFKALLNEIAREPRVEALVREEQDAQGRAQATAPAPTESRAIGDPAPPHSSPPGAAAGDRRPRISGFAHSVTQLARILEAAPGGGPPTAFERRLLSELSPKLMASLRAEIATGKTLRQACAGLEMGQDCERLPLKGNSTTANAGWSASQGATQAPGTEGSEPPPMDDAQTSEGAPCPPGGGKAPCCQWQQGFVFQCCNIAYCTKCGNDQEQYTYCDEDKQVTGTSCAPKSSFCDTYPSSDYDRWQKLFGLPKGASRARPSPTPSPKR